MNVTVAYLGNERPMLKNENVCKVFYYDILESFVVRYVCKELPIEPTTASGRCI